MTYIFSTASPHLSGPYQQRGLTPRLLPLVASPLLPLQLEQFRLSILIHIHHVHKMMFLYFSFPLLFLPYYFSFHNISTSIRLSSIFPTYTLFISFSLHYIQFCIYSLFLNKLFMCSLLNNLPVFKNTVLPSASSRIRSISCISAFASNAEVGSSTKISAASRTNDRARATFCHSPPESSMPPSKRLVSCVS